MAITSLSAYATRATASFPSRQAYGPGRALRTAGPATAGPELHLGGGEAERLTQSAAYFGFSMELPRITEELNHAASRLPAATHRVRLLVTRKGNVRCEARALASAAEPFADIAVALSPVAADDVFLYHKTTMRGLHERARASRPDAEAVLLVEIEGLREQSERSVQLAYAICEFLVVGHPTSVVVVETHPPPGGFG